MSDDDAIRIFRALTDILRTSELGWLADEVLAEIRRGKPKEKKIRVGESPAFVLLTEEPETPRGKPATFIESIEYKASEQLELLVAAIERGVVAPPFMEDEVASVLSKAIEPSGTASQPISFKFIAEGQDASPRECTEDDRRRRIAVSDILSHIMGLVREQIHASH